MKKLLCYSFIALLALCVARADDKLVIKGSDTLGAKLVPQLAEAFQATPGHKDVKFDIAAEGSTTGITAIIDNTADIGMASRRATAGEVSGATANGRSMTPTVVAYDGIAVIVNNANHVSKLTKKQVEQIFSGEVTDWSAIGGSPGTISVYTRNTASGTYKDFQKMAMSQKDYAGSAQKMAGNEEIASEVGKNPNGIGYVGMAYLKAAGVHPVAVDGVLPSIPTVRSRAYALSRSTFYYTNGKPTGLVKEFVDFTTSSAGQKIAQDVGFAPLK